MFSFLHAADIHLDSPLHKLDFYEGAPLEALRQATRRAFENLVELALTESVSFVLIAGDLYDGDWKDYNTGLYFISQMSKLREANIPVYIVAGNHDAASKITRTLRLPDNMTLFPKDQPATFSIKALNVAIHGQSFATPAVKKDLSIQYPSPLPGYFNIGLLHTCATGREGHEPYAPCNIQGLQLKGYDYWALGHVHQHEILLDDPPILFPGNIQGRHIKETGPKGCIRVTVDDDARAKIEFKALDVIRWVRIATDVSEIETGYGIIDLLGDHFEKVMQQNQDVPLIARVEIYGSTKAHDELAGDPEKWTNEVRSAAIDMGGGRIWIEKVKIYTNPSPDQSPETTTGPVPELIGYIDEIRSDPESLMSLGKTLDELNKKLPREFKEIADGIKLDDPVWLRHMLDNIRPMLLQRLLKQRDSV
jgi:DNA repair exonuclease SbcCD nuclease subunit